DGCDIATGSSVDANLNGAPDECEIPGDLNCDGAFDTQDIEPFVLALIDPVEYDAAFEDCNILNADLLPDSLINGSDVQSFAAQLIAP
ncbi:MAG TPA: hypothetical protein VNT79_00395, partial [Phycisphaerae bacterium]|nr:hypothetical protein [Phycisphaerae bacterium]